MTPSNLISMRDLRNNGRDVIRRVQAGDVLVITNNGEPVAELRPLPKKRLTTLEIMERWKHLPVPDPDKWRVDIDAGIDQSL